MLRNEFLRRTCWLHFLLVCPGVVCGMAQNTHGPSGEGGRPPGVLETEYVQTGLFVFSGAGGNSVLRLSGNGLIVVDGNHAENYDELRRRIHRISEQPVRVLVNTDYFERHTGTNAKFLADGTHVVGQANERGLLESYNPPSGKIAVPSDVFDKEQKLHFGLVEVDLLSFGKGVTGGDTVVYFPDLKAVALGDLYVQVPVPDYGAGGSLVGWGKALGEVLKLDFDVAVPGVGPTVKKADVAALKEKVDMVVSRGRDLVRHGVGKDKLMARLKVDDPGWKLAFTGAELDGFYGELVATK